MFMYAALIIALVVAAMVTKFTFKKLSGNPDSEMEVFFIGLFSSTIGAFVFGLSAAALNTI